MKRESYLGHNAYEGDQVCRGLPFYQKDQAYVCAGVSPFQDEKPGEKTIEAAMGCCSKCDHCQGPRETQD